MHFFSRTFQHTGHFFPLAFEVVTIISLSELSKISAEEVMHNSAKSVFFDNSNNSLLRFISKFASRLEPISLLALFSSILKLQISLILINSCHLFSNSMFWKFLGKSKNCSKCILPFFFEINW